jgi:hypothetical protein
MQSHNDIGQEEKGLVHIGIRLLHGIQDIPLDKERLRHGHDAHKLVFGIGHDKMGHDQKRPGNTHQIILPFVGSLLVLKLHWELGQLGNVVEMLLDDDADHGGHRQQAGDDVVGIVLPSIIDCQLSFLGKLQRIVESFQDVDVDDAIESIMKRIRHSVV